MSQLHRPKQDSSLGIHVIRVCSACFLLALVVWFRVGGVPEVLAKDFVRASAQHTWVFPRDHGQHPQYETEWWYYTGQLYAHGAEPFRDKPRLGFQLTFFRKSLRAGSEITQEYMAHAAVTDLSLGKTIFDSRLGGGAIGLAKVSETSLRSWSGDWTVDSIGEDLVLRFGVEDRGAQITRNLRIHIQGVPAPWLQGVRGMSQKAECDGCASLYYSLPRLALKAQYIQGEQEEILTGLGWMDHEFMTNSLAKSQIGWDWMGLMLKDGRSIMLFRVRNESAEKRDFYAAGVHSKEGSRILSADDISITPLSTWKSLRTGAIYPVSWRVQIAKEKIDTIVVARVLDSEVGDSGNGAAEKEGEHKITYWEGPVTSDDEAIVGYLEMTGYAQRVSWSSK